MPNSLLTILKTGIVTQKEIPEKLPAEASGLPQITEVSCLGEACARCAAACPTGAITVSGGTLSLDRGLCVGCSGCVETCPSGTLRPDLRTRTATRKRENLVLTNQQNPQPTSSDLDAGPFRRSLHVRVVSTGDSAADQETVAATNSVFDVARFGIHLVASPRFADALLVTGPV